jgi:hypothetical protein
MAKTEEAPKPAAQPPKNIVEVMAEEEYFQILLAENPNPEIKWGAHYVGINEYRTWLPREQDFLVAKSILNLLDHANQSIKYTDAEGNERVTRRQDLQIMSRIGPLSPEQAHSKRLEGKMPVFPTKIPPAIAEKLGRRLS